MKIPLQIALFEYYGGPILYDLTFEAESAEFQTNEFGYGYFTCTLRIDQSKASRIYQIKKTGYIRVGTGNKSYYEGRLEDANLVIDGIELTAYGYIRSFTDIQVTELWSSTKYEGWEVLTGNQRSGAKPEIFSLDNNNRLYQALEHDTTVSSSPFAEHYIRIPDKSTRTFNMVQFRYDLRNISLATVTVALQKLTYDLTTTQSPTANPWFITTTLSGIAGTHIVDMTSAPASGIGLVLQISTAGLFAGETGDISATFTNLRYGTSVSISGSRLYADEILRSTLSDVYTLNPQMINLNYGYIESPQYDLTDIEFEDLTGLDVIRELLAYPDSNGDYYECKVFDKQIIRFNRKGKYTRQWKVDIKDINLSRSLDEIANQTRIKYKSTLEVPVRTEYLTNADSVDTYGVKRQAYTEVDTTNTSAANIVNTALLDEKNRIQTIGTIEVEYVTDENGQRRSSIEVRSGDTITITGLPIVMYNDISRTFIVGETVYDIFSGLNRITPERLSTNLEQVLAKLQLQGKRDRK